MRSRFAARPRGRLGGSAHLFVELLTFGVFSLIGNGDGSDRTATGLPRAGRAGSGEVVLCPRHVVGIGT